VKKKDSLICFNPQGVVEIPTPVGLTNPRVKDLVGKKIGIFWDGKKSGDNSCIAVEELLKKKHPTAKIMRLVWGDVEAAEKAKKEVDTFIFGVGDSGMGGWGQCWNAIDLEKLGVAYYFAHFRKHIMVIHPELAIMLRRLGFKTKRSLRDHLYESAKVPYEKLSAEEIKGIEDRINNKPGGMFFANDAIPESQLPLFEEALKPGGRVPAVNSDEIHIIVSGSIPGCSFGMSYLRSAHKTKLIKGATLTPSGR
jgi:hypothetical protein